MKAAATAIRSLILPPPWMTDMAIAGADSRERPSRVSS
jgi:hypothetical protein